MARRSIGQLRDIPEHGHGDNGRDDERDRRRHTIGGAETLRRRERSTIEASTDADDEAENDPFSNSDTPQPSDASSEATHAHREDEDVAVPYVGEPGDLEEDYSRRSSTDLESSSLHANAINGAKRHRPRSRVPELSVHDTRDARSAKMESTGKDSGSTEKSSADSKDPETVIQTLFDDARHVLFRDIDEETTPWRLLYDLVRLALKRTADCATVPVPTTVLLPAEVEDEWLRNDILVQHEAEQLSEDEKETKRRELARRRERQLYLSTLRPMLPFFVSIEEGINIDQDALAGFFGPVFLIAFCVGNLIGLIVQPFLLIAMVIILVLDYDQPCAVDQITSNFYFSVKIIIVLVMFVARLVVVLACWHWYSLSQQEKAQYSTKMRHAAQVFDLGAELEALAQVKAQEDVTKAAKEDITRHKTHWLEVAVKARRSLEVVIYGGLLAMERYESLKFNVSYRIFQLITPVALGWDIVGIAFVVDVQTGECDARSTYVLLWVTALISAVAAVKRLVVCLLWLLRLLFYGPALYRWICRKAEQIDRRTYHGVPISQFFIKVLFASNGFVRFRTARDRALRKLQEDTYRLMCKQLSFYQRIINNLLTSLPPTSHAGSIRRSQSKTRRHREVLQRTETLEAQLQLVAQQLFALQTAHFAELVSSVKAAKAAKNRDFYLELRPRLLDWACQVEDQGTDLLDIITTRRVMLKRKIDAAHRLEARHQSSSRMNPQEASTGDEMDLESGRSHNSAGSRRAAPWRNLVPFLRQNTSRHTRRSAFAEERTMSDQVGGDTSAGPFDRSSSNTLNVPTASGASNGGEGLRRRLTRRLKRSRGHQQYPEPDLFQGTLEGGDLPPNSALVRVVDDPETLQLDSRLRRGGSVDHARRTSLVPAEAIVSPAARRKDYASRIATWSTSISRLHDLANEVEVWISRARAVRRRLGRRTLHMVHMGTLNSSEEEYYSETEWGADTSDDPDLDDDAEEEEGNYDPFGQSYGVNISQGGDQGGAAEMQRDERRRRRPSRRSHAPSDRLGEDADGHQEESFEDSVLWWEVEHSMAGPKVTRV